MSVGRNWKRLAVITGLLMLLVGAWSALVLLFVWLGTVLGGDIRYGGAKAALLGMAGLAGVALGSGFGWLIHGLNSLAGKPSRPLKAPPLWLAAGAWVVTLVFGMLLLNGGSAGWLLFPVVFVLAGALPPLAALAWSGGKAMQAGQDEISWRQTVVSFFNGATIAVGLAIVLEILLGVALAALLSGPLRQAQPGLEALFEQLTSVEAGRRLGSAAFMAALIELAVIAPLVEEFVKPLVVLPVLRAAESPRRAFLIGAAAGAGFAALENLLYTGFGLEFWGGVLVLRTLGAAIHPLGAGLTATGWRRALRGEPSAWLPKYATAVGIHALWNGGTVTLAALADTHFFERQPSEVNLLGVTMTGVVLAALAVVGAAAWYGLRLAAPAGETLAPGASALTPGPSPDSGRGESERMLARWAILCLVLFLPLGLAALILLRGWP